MAPSVETLDTLPFRLSLFEYQRMSDTQVSAPQQAQPFFGIQRVYLKGASLEIPGGANTFLEQTPADMDLNLEVANSVLADGIYEVVLRLTVTGKVNGKALFLVELEEAGIFEIRNLPADVLPSLLEVNAPHILTPYARAHLSDILARATLPLFMLPEINWPAMFAQKQAQQAAPAAANDSTALH